MDEPQQSCAVTDLFMQVCPKVNRGVRLEKQTWNEHIVPAHPQVAGHLKLVQEIIKTSDEQQAVWQKANNPKKVCIVRKVPHFLPENGFLLIALELYSDSMAVVTSVYPVDELPSKEKGYKLL